MSKKATGILNAHYAIYDPKTKVYGVPQPIKDLETLSITGTYAEGSNYADNLRNIYIKELVGADLSLTFSSISRAIEAELTGQVFDKCEVAYSTNVTAPQVALLFEKTYSDGSTDRIVYYNCKLSKDNENGETKGDSFNFVEDTLSGQAIPMSETVKTKENVAKNVDLNGILKYVIASDSLASASTDTAYKKRYDDFFKKIQFKGVAQAD